MTDLTRNKLIKDYIPLVRYISQNYAQVMSSILTYEEMFAIGCLALVQAAKSYDGSKGASFKTYAYILIRGAIIDEVRKLNHILHSRSVKAIKIGPGKDEFDIEYYFVSERKPDDQVAAREICEKLAEAVRKLSKRTQDLIRLYYFEDLTMLEIAKVLNITEGRVSQLNTLALNSLSYSLRNAI